MVCVVEQVCMSDHLRLRLQLLREYLSTDHPEVTNQLLVRLEPVRHETLGPNRSNIVLVLDDSGSMTGEPIEQVLAAARAIIDHLGPYDQLGIVGFADEAEVVHPLVGSLRRDSLMRVTDPYVWSHGRRGYGTNMALGLLRARDELRRHAEPGRINRMLVLTDGFASNPDATLEIAREIAAERVSMVSLGFGGEFDMDFMDRLAAPSGGACEYIDPRRMNATIRHFLDHLSSIQDQLTDHTRMSIRFEGDHRVTDFYQTHPRVIYFGLARLGADRVWSHRLADVERKQGLEMLFTLVHPRLPVGRHKVAEVEVHYDVPSVGHFDRVLRGTLQVEYGPDSVAFQMVHQRVQAIYTEAFVEKQQHRARRLIDEGANDDAARVLGTLRKRGNEEVRKLAEGTLRKLVSDEKVEREDLFRLKMGTQKKRLPRDEEEG